MTVAFCGVTIRCLTPHPTVYADTGNGNFGSYKTHQNRGLLVALVLLSLVRLGYFQRLHREYRHMITVSFSVIDSCRMIFMVSESPFHRLEM